MDVNAHREECDVKIQSGKTIRVFRPPSLLPPPPPRHSISLHETNTCFEIRPRYKKEEKRKERDKQKKRKKTMKKLQGCTEDYVAVCLRAFTLTFSDTSNLPLSLTLLCLSLVEMENRIFSKYSRWPIAENIFYVWVCYVYQSISDLFQYETLGNNKPLD